MAKSINEIVNKYHKTRKGILTQRYARMKYDAKRLGLEIPPQNVFRIMSLEDENFRYVYYDFERSNYDWNLSPVIERIDQAKGFNMENLKWVYKKDKRRNRSKSKEKIARDRKE